jgi:hypothetical protein
MNVRMQKACALGGAVMALAFLFGFWVLAGFIPPPDPKNDAMLTAQIFAEHPTGIRLGMILTMFAASLMVPWVSLITVYMKRIEGGQAPLAYAQLGLGAMLSVEFLLPLMVWEAATYRPQRSPEIIQFANDVSWLIYVGLSSTGVIEALVIGLAILADRNASPVFPRWLGYFNVWVALMFTPGSVNVFFKDGPLAWNGIIAWWLVLAAFSIWLPVMTWQLWLAVNRQAAALSTAAGSARANTTPTLESLHEELIEVRRRLAELTRTPSP